MKTTNIYKDDYVKEIFEYRRNKIVSMMTDLEILSVKKGLRDVAYMIVDKSNLIVLQKKYPELKFIILDTLAVDSFYSITSRQPESIEELGFRIAIVKPEFNANLFPYFSDNSDDIKKGKDLGYPQCCIDSFDEYWVKEVKIDYTWEQALNTEGAKIEENTITLADIPITSNGLMRWMGARPVFHMPCNFKCEKTQKIAEELKKLAFDHGYKKEWLWASEMLSWEIKWDTLHGIGILVTPISKVRFKTPYTAKKKTVIKKGQKDISIYKDWLWKDNGFTSYKAMENMHKPIEDLINELSDVNTIADLGCGNGYLMSKFYADVYGIDCNPEVIRRARKHFYQHEPEKFIVGDITQFEFEKEFDVVVMSAIRLIEMNKKDRMEFIAKMIEYTNHIVLTGYSDWLDAYGGLDPLIEKTGFKVIKKKLNEDNTSGAALVRWNR